MGVVTMKNGNYPHHDFQGVEMLLYCVLDLPTLQTVDAESHSIVVLHGIQYHVFLEIMDEVDDDCFLHQVHIYMT